MKSLNKMTPDQEGVVASIDGDTRFLSRITSIGLTPGCKVKVIKNDRSRPVLVFLRDTLVALNSKECERIMVEERSN
ncbi:MAG: ferrous iron transport protein A [Clostridia bacterium]|nr:ferrous iron transport protein A [Clostridia bacterium]